MQGSGRRAEVSGLGFGGWRTMSAVVPAVSAIAFLNLFQCLGIRVSSFVFRFLVSSFMSRGKCLGFPVSVSGPGIRVWGLGLGVSSSRFRISVSGLRKSGFDFQVKRFSGVEVSRCRGFQVQGFSDVGIFRCRGGYCCCFPAKASSGFRSRNSGFSFQV